MCWGMASCIVCHSSRELTSTDLLKNFLFSLVAKSETDLRQVKVQWKDTVTRDDDAKAETMTAPTFAVAIGNDDD